MIPDSPQGRTRTFGASKGAEPHGAPKYECLTSTSIAPSYMPICQFDVERLDRSHDVAHVIQRSRPSCAGQPHSRSQFVVTKEVVERRGECLIIVRCHQGPHLAMEYGVRHTTYVRRDHRPSRRHRLHDPVREALFT